jgi:Tfp pilus assembly protein PilP
MVMTTRSIRFVIAAAALVVALPAFAQTPPKKTEPAPAAPPAGTPAPGTPEAPKKPDLPAPPPNFEYSPQGRRDPFISLVNRGNEGSGTESASAKRLDGVPGMLTSELTVRGIVQTRGAWVAMVSGPDRKVYTVRAGDRLADGVVRTITANAVVILQEVNDPLSLEKQREVRKLLRGGEEVK